MQMTLSRSSGVAHGQERVGALQIPETPEPYAAPPGARARPTL